jgi:hypothetical protein
LNQTVAAGGTSEATVVLYSFDYGGQATITASTIDPDGNLIDSTIVLPLDSDRDLLPDDWEITHSTAGFSPYNTHSFTAALDDGQEDIDRSVNNAFVGDGLTNFREYRGIILDDTSGAFVAHLRLDPWLKDLFVRGDGFANSLPVSTAPDVLDFSVDYATVFGLSAGTPNAFEEAGIVVHDVTGRLSFVGPTEPPHIDILVVTNNTTETTTIDGYANGWTNHLGSRYWTWDTKGVSYIGIFDTYNLNTATGAQGTYLYHLNLMHYFHNRPYRDDITAPPLNSAYVGKLDPVDMVEDYRNENGIGPESFRGRSEDRWIENDILDGDYMMTDWKTVVPAGAESYMAGHEFSTFDTDGDGWVENPTVIDPVAAGLISGGTPDSGEYPEPQVQLHTAIHEMGHGVGIVDHTTDPICLMYENSINWNRAGHFSDYAQSQIMIHNKTE